MKAESVKNIKTKICKKCNKELPLDNYWKQPNNKDKLFGKCKSCAIKLINKNALLKQDKLDEGIWTCTSCNNSFYLNSDNFHLDCTTGTGYKSKCKKCTLKHRLNFTRLNAEDSLEYYLKEIINGAKYRARKKNISFELNLDILKNLWEKQEGKCSITGLSMTTTILKGKLKTNLSIDRIDSNKGYTIDNVQLVCVAVNIMKNTFTLDELKYFCNLIINKHE